VMWWTPWLWSLRTRRVSRGECIGRKEELAASRA
jgi:hypothetical protein